jgi:hypothetical protein
MAPRGVSGDMALHLGPLGQPEDHVSGSHVLFAFCFSNTHGISTARLLQDGSGLGLPPRKGLEYGEG